MAFKLGRRSLRELQGVHPDLVRVVRRAIQITSQDFGVHDGVRTMAEQRELVRSGASRTMKSRHITGHAVDLVPYVNGGLRWEWPPIYRIVAAVRTAAGEFGVPLEWGGVWDRRLATLDGDLEPHVEAYAARRRAAGKKVFLDGPHYQLPRRTHPA